MLKLHLESGASPNADKTTSDDETKTMTQATKVYLDDQLPSALHSFSASTQRNKAWLKPSVVKKKAHPKRMCRHCVCVCA